jgi:hypothetical protein
MGNDDEESVEAFRLVRLDAFITKATNISVLQGGGAYFLFQEGF